MSCLKCGKGGALALYQCGRCKRHFCNGCLEPCETIRSPNRCRECAVHDRQDEIDDRMRRMTTRRPR